MLMRVSVGIHMQDVDAGGGLDLGLGDRVGWVLGCLAAGRWGCLLGQVAGLVGCCGPQVGSWRPACGAAC